jgi:hypothetical protein
VEDSSTDKLDPINPAPPVTKSFFIILPFM